MLKFIGHHYSATTVSEHDACTQGLKLLRHTSAQEKVQENVSEMY